MVSISNDKKQLKELEDKILKLLKESTGNILDDEQLISTLNHSKLTSSVIANRVQEAEVRGGCTCAASACSLFHFLLGRRRCEGSYARGGRKDGTLLSNSSALAVHRHRQGAPTNPDRNPHY